MQRVANMSIKSRLYCGTLFCLSLLLTIGSAGFYALERTRTTVEDVFATRVETLTSISELRTQLGALQLHEKNTVANADTTAIAKEMFGHWQSTLQQTQAQSAALQRLQTADSSYAQKLEIVTVSLQRYAEDMMPLMQELKQSLISPGEGAQQSEFVRSAINDADALLSATLMQAQADLEQARTDIAQQAWQMKMLMLGVMLAGLLTMLPITIFSVRTIMRSLHAARAMAQRVAAGDLSQDIAPTNRDEVGQLVQAMAEMQHALRSLVAQVQSASSQVSVASAEIAAGNAHLSQRTEGTSSHLHSTFSAMEALSTSVQRNVQSSDSAHEQAKTASEIAQRGHEVTTQVVQTMSQIADSSERIAHITGVIDSIAFQTNILALNAAVEAARAGEQGRGFAVVANEVRSLAARSAEAAREIKALIAASSSSVDTGAALVQQAGSTMEDIVGSVNTVAQVIAEVNESARQQHTQITQVLQAVDELEQMSQQNAALVEQSSAASASLRDQAHMLDIAAQQFAMPASLLATTALADALHLQAPALAPAAIPSTASAKIAHPAQPLRVKVPA